MTSTFDENGKFMGMDEAEWFEHEQRERADYAMTPRAKFFAATMRGEITVLVALGWLSPFAQRFTPKESKLLTIPLVLAEGKWSVVLDEIYFIINGEQNMRVNAVGFVYNDVWSFKELERNFNFYPGNSHTLSETIPVAVERFPDERR